MKPVDLLLLSLAIGLTLFSAYLLGSPAPADAISPAPPPRPVKNAAFRSIVLHHNATHSGNASAFERTHRGRLGGLAYHFIVGNGSGSPDGEVETGYRWHEQAPGPHTKNVAANHESIAICLVGDLESRAPTLRQFRALLHLLEQLCREYAIPADRVHSHREVDAESRCPGKGFPIEAIREAIARRLPRLQG